jgi:hypothetical protein
MAICEVGEGLTWLNIHALALMASCMCISFAGLLSTLPVIHLYWKMDQLWEP